ncbi:WD40 repeat-like protein [Macrolepiota fuliginosa MF-IS2]|uniref:WD40 repeat-like protein n=1 Tax=Macrolepiota fuliginosa MF-IS2 TaxID=1400762 RepID=A0A9P5XJA5_9AGAR|nr:WD40 repeat-like protein [Macrolepiota fuliginosa MF-IS2]
MNLARHSISSARPVNILDARFDADTRIFTTSTQEGFAVYRTWPLELVRKRELSDGTLSHVLPLHSTNLLFLVGGGRSPLYPANKVVVWDDALGKEVAELEFKSQVRGLACRRGWLAVALRRRVVVFQVGGGESGSGGIKRYAEWETCDNQKGLLAIATAPKSTLLAIAGRQLGHVQLIHLPPCPEPKSRNPPPNTKPVQSKPGPSTSTGGVHPVKHAAPVIVAHTTALTSLSLTPSGRLIATTSAKGTLVRVWDTATGTRIKELRRGTDKAEIYGVAFRPDEKEVCVWSDKGTIHVFSLAGAANRQSTFSPLTPFLPLPKYFESEWSYAQYRIPVQSSHISLSSTRPAVSSSSLSSAPVVKDTDVPDEERCVVGWVQVATEDNQQPSEGGNSSGAFLEWQLIALTYVGGWYRLALPLSGKDRKRERGGSTVSAGAGTGGSVSGRESLSAGSARRVSGTLGPSPLGGGGGGGSIVHGSPPKAVQMSRRGSSASTVRGAEKGKDREKEREKERESRNCTLQEYRRFGRWDGWG